MAANNRWLRFLLIGFILGTTFLMVGYRLTQPDPQAVVADLDQAKLERVIETRVLDMQVLSSDEALPGPARLSTPQMIVFTSEMFDYHLDYPLGWSISEISARVSRFQSPDGQTRVEVEAKGSLPDEGLKPLVERSLREEMVLSHQLLTIHGQTAERVVAYSETLVGQKTTFFIEHAENAFVITGSGEQRMIEMMARSFNAPQAVALR